MAVCTCTGGTAVDPRYESLQQIITERKGAPGSLIMVLHEAQQLFGYLPEDVIQIVAEGLDVPLSEVYGVVTFYSLFSLKPRGKYKISVCMGTACYVKGAAQVVAELEKQLKIKPAETTDDGRFTMEICRCIGACGLAPVMTINDDVYGRLTPNKIAEILAKYE
ncbi:MAG: NADH-quinone oxidoreductase subunit NuoE [Bacillota bacterium]